MTKRTRMRDIAASVRARLLNLSKRRQIDFNRVLLLYFQQCFLARLARSTYREKFVLKGGLLFYASEPFESRPTKDIDLLGRGFPSDPEKVVATLKEVLKIELHDGVYFSLGSVHWEAIAERGTYAGVRIFVPALLGAARQNLQIDVAFGDAIIPGPVEFDYPCLLSQHKIRMYAYSWCSVIAEKFEAAVRFSDLSSRMKDYYDMYHLQSRFSFDGRELNRALRETFERRHTDISAARYILSVDFAASKDKQKQWKAFLSRNDLPAPRNFSVVISSLARFLRPIVSAMARGGTFDKVWDHRVGQWLMK